MNQLVNYTFSSHLVKELYEDLKDNNFEFFSNSYHANEKELVHCHAEVICSAYNQYQIFKPQFSFKDLKKYIDFFLEKEFNIQLLAILVKEGQSVKINKDILTSQEQSILLNAIKEGNNDKFFNVLKDYISEGNLIKSIFALNLECGKEYLKRLTFKDKDSSCHLMLSLFFKEYAVCQQPGMDTDVFDVYFQLQCLCNQGLNKEAVTFELTRYMASPINIEYKYSTGSNYSITIPSYSSYVHTIKKAPPEVVLPITYDSIKDIYPVQNLDVYSVDEVYKNLADKIYMNMKLSKDLVLKDSKKSSNKI